MLGVGVAGRGECGDVGMQRACKAPAPRISRICLSPSSLRQTYLRKPHTHSTAAIGIITPVDRGVCSARASSALILGRVSLCFERAVLLVGDGEDLMRLGSGSGLGLTVRSSAVGVGVNSAWAASSCVSCSLCEIESLSTKASSNLREREMEGGKEGAHQGVRNTPCTREPTPRTVTWSLH